MNRPVKTLLTLGSGSPRRAELLRQLGLDFDVLRPDIDETPRKGEEAGAYVARMSRAKSAAIRLAVSPDRLVLCADTTVTLDDMILGKPGSAGECEDMLMRLSGRRHSVLTALSLGTAAEAHCQVVETIVAFRHLTREECHDYWLTGEPVDKAGGYGIQGLGATLVESISGSYSNVVGLPLMETATVLRKFGIDCLKRQRRPS